MDVTQISENCFLFVGRSVYIFQQSGVWINDVHTLNFKKTVTVFNVLLMTHKPPVFHQCVHACLFICPNVFFVTVNVPRAQTIPPATTLPLVLLPLLFDESGTIAHPCDYMGDIAVQCIYKPFWSRALCGYNVIVNPHHVSG